MVVLRIVWRRKTRPKTVGDVHTNKCTIISVCLIQRQIGGSHNAYFKQEISVYLLLTEMPLFVCFGVPFGVPVRLPEYNLVYLIVPLEEPLMFPP